MSKKFIVITLIAICPSLTSAATLSLSPSSQSLKTGETFRVSVNLDTQGASIDGVDLHYLTFDPSQLQVVDANSSSAGVQVAPGSIMPTTIANSVDNAAGKVTFSQIAMGGTKYKGSGVLATITFKAIKASTARVSFDFQPNDTRDTNVASAGKDVLTAVVNGSYTLSGSTVNVNNNTVSNNNTNYNISNKTKPQTSVVTKKPVNTNTDLSVQDQDLDEEIVLVEAKDPTSIRGLLNYIIDRILKGINRVFGRI